MLELRMTTDLQEATPAEIGFNFEELKAELAERLHYYNELVVTEEGIKEAKADRAKLNKLRKAIDTRRKDIKNEYLRPYNDFESKVKELTLLIDQPIKAIDTQLEDFETRRKEEKKAKVVALYHDTVPEDLRGIISLERIFDQKWLNTTTAMSRVEQEMQTCVQRVTADLLVIDTVEPEYQAAVKQKYIETLDIATALIQRDKLKAAEEAYKAREARKEAEKKAQDAKKAEEDTNTQPAEEKPAEAPKTARIEQKSEEPELYTLALEFRLTRTQAVALRNFLTSHMITYRKI